MVRCLDSWCSDVCISLKSKNSQPPACLRCVKIVRLVEAQNANLFHYAKLLTESRNC